MPHYMMDCFHRGTDQSERKDRFPIAASSDDEAIREAELVAILEKPSYFHVRIIARKGDRIIYRSNA